MSEEFLTVFSDLTNTTWWYAPLVDKFKGSDRENSACVCVVVNIHNFVLCGLLHKTIADPY